MTLLGEKWPHSPVHIVTDDAGEKMTFTVHEFGLTMSDRGGTSQYVHCEDTADPDVKKIGDSFFRRLPA
jgi:hypothetical protein